MPWKLKVTLLNIHLPFIKNAKFNYFIKNVSLKRCWEITSHINRQTLPNIIHDIRLTVPSAVTRKWIKWIVDFDKNLYVSASVNMSNFFTTKSKISADQTTALSINCSWCEVINDKTEFTRWPYITKYSHTGYHTHSHRCTLQR